MNKHSQPGTNDDFFQLREVKEHPGRVHTSDAESLMKLFQIIWYRKVLLFGTAILLTAVSSFVIFQLTPLYSAKTVLMIEPGLPAIESSNSVIEVLRSRGLADKVINHLDLDKDPEFNKALLPPGQLNKFIRKFTGTRENITTSEDALRRQERAQIIDTFLKKLEVSSVRRSYIVNIVFVSENPLTADLIVKKLAELYIHEQLVSKIETTEQAALWLHERIMSSYNGESSLVEVLNSELIRRLREQEANVARTIANLSREHGDGHPKMKNAHAELSEIRSRIQHEIGKIVKGIENEAHIARKQRASLEQNLKALERGIEKSNSAEVLREAESNRIQLNKLLSRLNETKTQNDGKSQRIDARIVSRTDTPPSYVPIFPKKRLLLPLAFIASFFVGLSLVFAKELFSRGYKSGEEIEQLTGFPNLGLVPKISRFKLIGKSLQDKILNEPKSAFSESVRTLYDSSLLFNLERPPKSILITSGQPKEGKTTCAPVFSSLWIMSSLAVSWDNKSTNPGSRGKRKAR